MKAAWVLTRAKDTAEAAFRSSLTSLMPERAARLTPSLSALTVTLREPGAAVTASLRGASVDALVELVIDDPEQPLDPLTELLAGEAKNAQGWLVEPTTVYDVAPPVELGEPSADVVGVIFIQRLDGTTRDHFSRNWYRHAGIDADGAGVSPAREHFDEDGPTARYVQNRVIESITPAEWPVHGYSQLHAPWVIPELPDAPYERFRGEEPFDRWPPRLFQGREYRMV